MWNCLSLMHIANSSYTCTLVASFITMWLLTDSIHNYLPVWISLHQTSYISGLYWICVYGCIFVEHYVPICIWSHNRFVCVCVARVTVSTIYIATTTILLCSVYSYECFGDAELHQVDDHGGLLLEIFVVPFISSL